eukprot:CAMPEP_0178994832 /NCGR_PEP_ID=MMETSP0795-20121207/7497_1 /TAXON_ID=88552 /ORGANISM="Amoebophrya sp., Strain Ameob2" /LENGTH=154 /DNA_ID=CAMNT_0020687085 /DNA_START=188 /DNA_END=652 /DNA_ORIENTATION=-
MQKRGTNLSLPAQQFRGGVTEAVPHAVLCYTDRTKQPALVLHHYPVVVIRMIHEAIHDSHVAVFHFDGSAELSLEDDDRRTPLAHEAAGLKVEAAGCVRRRALHALLADVEGATHERVPDNVLLRGNRRYLLHCDPRRQQKHGRERGAARKQNI